jgi:hypothetical protein
MYIIIPHILITINRLIWVDNGYKSEHVITQDKNHIPWNKNHIPTLPKPRGFSRQSYRSLTGKRQRHSKRIIWRRPLQCGFYISETTFQLKYVCQQYFTYRYMCFLGFIRYNKTSIACGYRKYENLFTHEYHIPPGRCPRGIWHSWVNKFSYFPHQHAINVYYYLIVKFYMLNKVFIVFNYWGLGFLAL